MALYQQSGNSRTYGGARPYPVRRATLLAIVIGRNKALARKYYIALSLSGSPQSIIINQR